MRKTDAAALLFIVLAGTSLNGFSQEGAKPSVPLAAKKECTALPVSEWLPEEEFKVLMRHRGYKDFKFKIVYQSCYEIYGYDAKNQLIEAYFNPSNAKLDRMNVIQVPEVSPSANKPSR